MQKGLVRLLAGWGVCILALGALWAPARMVHAQTGSDLLTRTARRAASDQVVPEFVHAVGGQSVPADVAIVDGSTAYVGKQTQLSVLDVSNPAQPVERAHLDLSAPASDIFLHDGTAYVATQDGKVHIVDVRTPTTPAVRGVYTSAPIMGEAGRSANSVYVVGTHAYIAYTIDRSGSYRSQFQIVDVSNPAAPTVRGVAVPGLKAARDVFVVNHLAYVAFSSPDAGGIVIYDVSNPAKPVVRGTLATQPPEQVYVAGNRAYLAVYASPTKPQGLLAIDVSDPAQPRVLGQHIADVTAVQVVGSLAYLSGPTGLMVVDVSNPKAMVERGRLPTSGEANTVFVDRTHAFVSARGGFHVVDVQTPERPRLCNADITRRVIDAYISDSFAYMYDVAGDAALQIADLRDPAQPVFRGRLPVTYVIEDIDIAGTTAYLAAGSDGVQIVDVSDADQPRHVGQLDTPGYAYAIRVNNGVAYIADGDAGLQIVDVRDTAQPKILGALDTPGVSIEVALQNTTVYLGDIVYVDEPVSNAGVRIVDATDPAAPAERGMYGSLPVQNLKVKDDLAYVAAGTTGLALLDVSNPAAPTLRGSMKNLVALDVAVAGTLAHVATGDGVQILDLSDPSAPAQRGTIDTPGYAQIIQVVGDLVLIADDDGGLQIWRVKSQGEKFSIFSPLAS